MADIVVKTEDAADGAVSSVAKDVGVVTERTEHHAEALADHTEQLANVEQDAEWTKNRLAALERELAERPDPDTIRVLTEELSSLRSTVASQAEKLSATLAENGERTSETVTEAPAEVVNEAEKATVSGPFANLRKALHRLL